MGLNPTWIETYTTKLVFIAFASYTCLHGIKQQSLKTTMYN